MWIESEMSEKVAFKGWVSRLRSGAEHGAMFGNKSVGADKIR